MATIADILMEQGRSLANARRARGQLIGNAVAQLGQIPQQVMDDRQRDQDRAAVNTDRIAQAKLRDLQTKEAQGQVAAQQRAAGDLAATDAAVGSGLDLATITQQLAAAGHGHLIPAVTKSWNDAETAKVNLQDARTKAADAENDYFGALAAGVKPFTSGPDGGLGAVTIALQHAKAAGYTDADQLLEQIKANPTALPTMVDSLIQKSPTQRKLLGEEGDRALRQTTEQRMAAQATAAAANVTADNQRADAAAAETSRHNKAMEARPVAGALAGQALTDDGIDYAATQYRLTGKMPALGNGAGDVKAKIISNAAAQAKALGQSPVASIQRQAAYAGDAKALAKMQGMSASAEAFENKAIQQAGIVRDLSDKVGRTQYPILNQAIVAGKADLLGDRDAQLLYNSITTFASEYAKIMEGATGSAAGSSDASRAAAQRLISAKLNKGTMRDTLDLMQREMQLTIGGYGAVIDHITSTMGGTPQTPQVGGSAQTIRAKDPQGNIHEAPAGTALPTGWVLQ